MTVVSCSVESFLFSSNIYQKEQGCHTSRNIRENKIFFSHLDTHLKIGIEQTCRWKLVLFLSLDSTLICNIIKASVDDHYL